MSEEILKALTQLFAIFSKQDGGVSEEERNFVIGYFNQELDQDSIKEYLDLFDTLTEYNKEGGEKKEKKLTSVKDSVRTLGICKKINKTLTQKQKIVVLFKIMELINSDPSSSPQQMEILDTVSEIFNFDKDEFRIIETFVFSNNGEAKKLCHKGILYVSKDPLPRNDWGKYLQSDLNGMLTFVRVNSVNMYFAMYKGTDELLLNGFGMKPSSVYNFSQGSTIKTPKGDALYYSDLISKFAEDSKSSKLSFNAKNLEFRFPNGDIGLRDIKISEKQGKLIGIMGASGAGKTTLLNVLAGIEKPSSGEVLINGINIHQQKDSIRGVIGYISQDDLLIEELTVYQNLFYNAKLCFADLAEEELDKRVMTVLESLGLEQSKDLKVGSILDKTISGGQRKRLNIALELIREPAVLFVDEPTSGLSSKDSENVIDLLKELSLKGKLIFVVIHQPSSDIYKMFDKMFIMDTGGYPVFYGNPVESVTYFKEVTHQIDKNRGQCITCGNVNPEQIFNIIEARVVDEYGLLTNKRKVTPQQWNDKYLEKFELELIKDVQQKPPHLLNIPNKIKQTIIFTIRDTISKISNKQYLLINALEAPVLALILAIIIRYKNSSGGEAYIFRNNENIPAFLMMSIVVALFMGLSVSAEEIIKDRKILRRESFLNLSWGSYLASKHIILFIISAIQALSFVLIGNIILEIQGMTLSFWLVLFSVSCFSNVIGLNVSSAFNSAITVYILIPIILIPQMILSGLMFSYDKLNEVISTKGKVPLIADMMVSRWALEAMMVQQFQSNEYESPFFELEKEEMEADFKTAYLIKELRYKKDFIIKNHQTKDDSLLKIINKDIRIIKNEFYKEEYKKAAEGFDVWPIQTAVDFNQDFNRDLGNYYDRLESYYLDKFNLTVKKKEKLAAFLENSQNFDYDQNVYKDKYYNQSLADLVRNINTTDRIIEYKGNLVQLIDPVFNDPEPMGIFDYRAHFYAPTKHFLGVTFSTFYFNIIVIWLMTFIFYITLYYELLRKMLKAFSKVNVGMKKAVIAPK